MLLSRRKYLLFSILDSVLALCLIFPVALSYWRGIWDLMDYYILPGQAPMQHWVMAAMGHLQLIGFVCLPYLDKTLDRSKKAQFWIITRLFLYINSLFFMAYWEGVWSLYDDYFGTDWQYSLLSLSFFWIILIILNACKSALWPPIVVCLDGEPGMLTSQNKFNSKVSDVGWKMYIADVYFSHFVIWAIVIGCWRSMTNLVDRVVWGSDKFTANSTAALIGLAGIIVLLSLQLLLSKVYNVFANKGWTFLKLLWRDAVHTVTFISLSFFWRGVWNLSVSYFIPQKPLGPWVSFALGSVGLLTLQAMSCMVAFGVVDDRVEPDSDAFYSIKYLRIFFKNYLEKEALTKNLKGDNERLVTLTKEDKTYSSLK